MIKIDEKKNCCGCSACANVCPKRCIRMVEDNEGFLYPEVEQDICINCGLCERVCPIKNPVKEQVNLEQKAFVAKNRDEVVLRESTSGGAFSAIAKWVINQGGIVFGARLNQNFEVEHVAVEKYEDLKVFRNSKYVQSNIGKTFCQVRNYLNDGRIVLFSGTGCQLEGLLHFLQKNYENLYTIDVICRAVPSPLVLRKYLEMQRLRGLQISDVKFRDKYHGYKYSSMSLFTSNNHDYHEGIDTDVYLRAFFSGMSFRPSCSDCKFRKRYRRTDMTIWDCFTIDEFSKELDNDKGATRILIHSSRAKKIVEEMGSDLKIVEIDVESAIKGVKELTEGPIPHPQREAFFEDLNALPAEDVFEKYFPITLRHRLEKQARLWSNRLGIYKIMKKIFKCVYRKETISR